MPRKKTGSNPAQYTKPELRDKIKERITAGDKGGRPGQWSARKAQLVTQEYEREGGGYKRPPTKQQRSLKRWGDEEWATSDGSKATRKAVTKRYLPKAAWKQLTPAERDATERKKETASRQGTQFVANTTKAAAASRRVRTSTTAAKKVAAPVRKTAQKRAQTKRRGPKRG